MKNLIRAQLFQLKKEKKFIILTILITLFFDGIQIISPYMEGEINMTFGKFLASYTMTGYSVILYGAAAAGGVITALICTGSDFRDKTFYYEVMNGYTRLNVFAAKTIVALIAGMVIYILTLGVSYIGGILLYGFGTELEVGEVMLRFCLSMFVEARLICIFVALCYLLRIFWVWIIVAFVYFLLGPDMFAANGSKSYLLGMSTFSKLGEYVSWTTYTIEERVEYIYVYGAKIVPLESLAIVASSIGIGIISLLIGFYFFKKDDLH